ncbi:MAG: hypothetical protein LWX70_05485 [Sphingobacteriia bacterium]|nr:hypothetical protein [Sphingobacteriia bacterium]
MRSGKKIALNTGILYLKMILTAGITLYTTRLVLEGLGIQDYGVYNLIGGVIAMLAFLNAAMSTSTQRFFSYHQGKDDIELQKRVFSNSLILHFIIGIVMVIVIEIAGLFLFDGFLNIPSNRIDAAKIIYHTMTFTVFFSVISVPYSASLSAHENMLWIAIVGIVEVILKLAVALMVFWFVGDKLVFYAIFVAAVSVVVVVLYAVYCIKRYEEVTLFVHGGVNKPLMKELASFAGWNLFGAACGVARAEGIAIVLNIFFGTIINAAYGIANQLSGQLNFFSLSMLKSMNPQIMRAEGAGERKRMLWLSMKASRFGYYLLAFISIPFIFEMDHILAFWLKTVPDNTAIFCILILIASLVRQLTVGLQSAAQATGRIKLYQVVVGGVLLLNLPAAWLLLKFGYAAYSVLFSFIVVEVLSLVFRLFFLRVLAGMSIRNYSYMVFYKAMIPTIVSVAVSYLIAHYLVMDFRFIINIVVTFIAFSITIYLFGLEKDEKEKVLSAIQMIKSKIVK